MKCRVYKRFDNPQTPSMIRFRRKMQTLKSEIDTRYAPSERSAFVLSKKGFGE
jgi:hypothetical protein